MDLSTNVAGQGGFELPSRALEASILAIERLTRQSLQTGATEVRSPGYAPGSPPLQGGAFTRTAKGGDSLSTVG